MYYNNPEQNQYQTAIPGRTDINPETPKKSPRVIIIPPDEDSEDGDSVIIIPTPKEKGRKWPFTDEPTLHCLENLLN